MTAGRDRFAGIALEHLARAVAADELRVGYREVSARVRDESGALGVRVTAPVALAPLGSPDDIPLVDRLTAAGGHIRARLAELTGLDVARVDLRAAGAVITERRVR